MSQGPEYILLQLSTSSPTSAAGTCTPLSAIALCSILAATSVAAISRSRTSLSSRKAASQPLHTGWRVPEEPTEPRLQAWFGQSGQSVDAGILQLVCSRLAPDAAVLFSLWLEQVLCLHGTVLQLFAQASTLILSQAPPDFDLLLMIQCYTIVYALTRCASIWCGCLDDDNCLPQKIQHHCLRLRYATSGINTISSTKSVNKMTNMIRVHTEACILQSVRADLRAHNCITCC